MFFHLISLKSSLWGNLIFFFIIHSYFTHMSLTISVLFDCSSNFIFYFCPLFLISPYFLIFRKFIRSANLTLKARKPWTFPQFLIAIGRFLPSFFNYWLLFIVFVPPFISPLITARFLSDSLFFFFISKLPLGNRHFT